MEIFDRIRDMIDDNVTDIFVAMQDELGIDCGDCDPADGFNLDKASDALAEIIAEIIRRQAGE